MASRQSAEAQGLAEGSERGKPLGPDAPGRDDEVVEGQASLLNAISKVGDVELAARALVIAGVARESALETERQRHVSAELIGRMREAELFRVLQPARFGGFEFGYDVFVELVAAIAAGDGSTGWVYSLGAVHPWLIACYPEEAQQEVWNDDRDAIAAVSYAPVGRAVPDRDGYRLSGRFSFASGCDNANW